MGVQHPFDPPTGHSSRRESGMLPGVLESDGYATQDSQATTPLHAYGHCRHGHLARGRHVRAAGGRVWLLDRSFPAGLPRRLQPDNRAFQRRSLVARKDISEFSGIGRSLVSNVYRIDVPQVAWGQLMTSADRRVLLA